MGQAKEEIDARERFAFGDNWRQFLQDVDSVRINDAVDSLSDFLGVDHLRGRTFVDVGSGSGLFSLAARNLGAEVLSFDFDPQSVACTEELRRRFRPHDSDWRVEQGSILNDDYVESLGRFDVVYSWGVLHHTGDMAAALSNADKLAAENSKLFIAIYNDQGRTSRRWAQIKRLYNRSGRVRRSALVGAVALFFRLGEAIGGMRLTMYRLRKRIPAPARAEIRRVRGMDRHRDLVDWVGGYPFEVATPDQVFDFYKERGYSLSKMVTCGRGLGCNQFVFEREKR